MVSKVKKTIGFFPPKDNSWMGGVHYYCNLFHALSKLKNTCNIYVVFVGEKADQTILYMYMNHGAKIVQTSSLDKFSISWFIDRMVQVFFGTRPILNRLLDKHSISLVSHIQSDIGIDCPQVAWIPDFQHVHLPQMFSEKEITSRNKNFKAISKKADAVILSSYDALKDYSNFVPEYALKGRVARFVSQPPAFYFDLKESDYLVVKDKYSIDRPYIYVPNQFWRHKNHQLILEAVLLCKDRGEEPLILCSGLMEDYRNASYADSLVEYVSKNRLTDNVKFLGLIPYRDVFTLIKFSIVVMNPSQFEGWSSSVEECKSVDKAMLLSDIAVHKEQYPESLFFNVNSHSSLADKITQIYANADTTNDIAVASLEDRTLQYGVACADIYSEFLV